MRPVFLLLKLRSSLRFRPSNASRIFLAHFHRSQLGIDNFIQFGIENLDLESGFNNRMYRELSTFRLLLSANGSFCLALTGLTKYSTLSWVPKSEFGVGRQWKASVWRPKRFSGQGWLLFGMRCGPMVCFERFAKNELGRQRSGMRCGQKRECPIVKCECQISGVYWVDLKPVTQIEEI